MTDDEKKRRYRNIVYRLYSINNKIETLNSDINSLEDITAKSVIINDKTYNADKITSTQTNLTNASNSIKGNIIPSLNRKIYS